jgi:hypothetical protein
MTAFETAINGRAFGHDKKGNANRMAQTPAGYSNDSVKGTS